MKIGFFTDTYLPIRYGVENSIESFRLTLEAMKHRVSVAAPYFRGYLDTVSSGVFRFKSFKFSKKTDMRLALPIMQDGRLKEIYNYTFDVIHAHTPFTVGLVGRHVARRQNIPLIYTHHTDYLGCISSYLGRISFVARMTDKLAMWFARESDAVIAPSEKMKDIMLKAGVNRPIHILPTGVNSKHFVANADTKKSVSELRNKYHLKPTTKVIMTLSRVGKEKNIDFSVRAFKKIADSGKDIRLFVVGSGPHRNALIELAKDLGIEDKVIFPGFVPSDEKPAYYQLADVFLYTSHADTQAIVLLEAISSGLPVVALRDGAFTGIVIENKNGLLVDNDSEDVFVSRVLELLSDKALYAQMSAESLKIAKQFSEEKMTEKLVAIYEEAIKNKI